MTGDQARFLNIGDRVCGRRIKPIKAPSVKERRGDGGRPAAHAGDANLVITGSRSERGPPSEAAKRAKRPPEVRPLESHRL